MSAATEFDIGPLTWVKGEIEQALGQAGAAITAFGANPLDTTQLKFCKTHLHQAHGALDIVGLEGVTRLTEESERLIDAIDSGAVAMTPDIGRVLVAGFVALGAYLDELVEGAAHHPVRLFPAYSAVMQARGAERILESDLFFPDLSPRPPRREAPELPVDMRQFVLGQRRRFQAGLLRWLRNAADNAALREMTESVRAIERTQALAQHRAFWWVTIGFTEALIAVGAQAGNEGKRLCARIDLQMKRLMEGSQNVAERLLRDTLYFVARSRVQSPHVQEIRRVFALDQAIPDQSGQRRDPRPFDADLRALREIIALAKDKWNRFSSGHTHELVGFREQAAQLKDRVANLEQPDLALLVSAISSVTVWVADNPGRVTEAIALETATALLLAESAVENFARISPEFPQQVVAMGARLHASLGGQPTDVPPPVLDEMARKAQERLVMAQVVIEIKSNLSSIEATLDGFFRDTAKRIELPSLDVQLRQVSGALSMLGAERAVAALAECRAEITRFAAEDCLAAPGDFERVAQTMSGLGFYIEALQHGVADFDTLMRPMTPRRPRAVEEETQALPVATLVVDFPLDDDASAPPPPSLTVEAELDLQRKDARTLFEAWRDKPGDSVLAAELKANLESIQQDADLVDEPGLQTSAGRALELLDQPSHSGPTLADIEQAMAEVAPHAAAEAVLAPSAEVAALAGSSAEVVDAELLAIFLEEAGEVLAAIKAQHVLVAAEPSLKDALTIVRRGFHTLKGSGRMVGLHRLGEAAWAAEQVMNQWLQDVHPASPDLLAMIGAAHALFARWIDELARTGVSAVAGEPLIAACERMRAGLAFAMPLEAVGAAPVAADAANGFPERSIIIGDMRVSPSLYGIFVDEAGTHLAVMQAELVLLSKEPQPPRDELVRAAHTLAGIAGTVSFKRLHELARAFERALLVAKSAGIVPDADDLALLHAVVGGIDALVAAVRQLRQPPPIEPLEARLELMRAEWLAESGEIDPTLLHLEMPPIEDDQEEPGARVDEPAASPANQNVQPTPALPAEHAEVDFDFSSDADLVQGATAFAVALDGMASDAGDAPLIDVETTGAHAASLDFDVSFDAAGASAIAFGPADQAPPAPHVGDAPELTTAHSIDLLFEDAPVAPDQAGSQDVGKLAAAGVTGSDKPSDSALAPDNADHAPPPALRGADPSSPIAAMPDSLTAIGALAGLAAAAGLAASATGRLATDEDQRDQAIVPGEAAVSPALPMPVGAQPPAPLASAAALEAIDLAVPPALPTVTAQGRPASDAAALHVAELRARGFDPAERLLTRIEDEIDPQLLSIFLEEAAELVPQLGQQLRIWSNQPGDARNAQALQRTLHTLKGSARMAGAMAIGQVTHSMETRIENGLGLPAIPPAIMDGLILSYDRVSQLFEALRGGEEAEQGALSQELTESGADATSLDRSVHAQDSAADAPPADLDSALVLSAAAPGAGLAPSRAPHAAPLPQAGVPQGIDQSQRAMLRVRADLVDRLVNEAGEVAIARSRIEGELRAVKSSLKELTESVTRLRSQLREIEIAAELQMQSRQREAEVKHETFDPLEFDRFSRFQEITRMMAESVNDVATVQQGLIKNIDDADLAILAQARLNRDLQGGLMRVRMVPFNNLAERLYRVVRQTAKALGKRANLDIRGVQTEIDRSVLERMTGPFEHLLRNAIAHGLEEPAARSAAAKDEIGQIVLSARQEGNEFILVLEDDGRGLDLPKIRARANAAGLAREGDLLADAQVAEFIFAPGFSTADEVSAIAGRGIGMDVVRAEVAALGGRIDTEFKPAQGTRFTIALPLTLAVTQVVLARAGTHLYAIPSVTVEQVRQVRAEDLVAAYAAKGIFWQERDYPLFYLPRLLGDPAQAAQTQRFTPVLLVRSGNQRAAIHVDALAGNQEVVVKNIGPQLARVTGIAGATVLGNGKIVLILNPVPLAVQAVANGMARSGVVVGGNGIGDNAAIARLLPAPSPLVMVVDDSLTVRKITSRLLTRENYQVLTARDGVDALEQLQGVRPDLLLVDIEMPRMDGFDLTRNVRADATLKDIPIIMITSRTADKHRKYAQEVGVNFFLGKPFQEDELLENIAALVRKPVTTA